VICFLPRQSHAFESDDDLDVDAILEAEWTALGKIKTDELRKQDEERKKKLMDEWSASVSAKQEEKKRAEAAAAEEWKDESKLLVKERQLNEELSRLKKETLLAQTALNNVTSALRRLKQKRQNQETEKRKELAARIKRSVLKNQEFLQRSQRRLSESVRKIMTQATGQSWADFGPVLPLPAPIMLEKIKQVIGYQYWPNIGQYCFWKFLSLIGHIGPILGQYCANTVPILAQYWADA